MLSEKETKRCPTSTSTSTRAQRDNRVIRVISMIKWQRQTWPNRQVSVGEAIVCGAHRRVAKLAKFAPLCHCLPAAVGSKPRNGVEQTKEIGEGALHKREIGENWRKCRKLEIGTNLATGQREQQREQPRRGVWVWAPLPRASCK